MRLSHNENNNDHVGWRPTSFGYHSNDSRLYCNDGSNNSNIDYETKPYDPKWGSGGGRDKKFDHGNSHEFLWV